MDNIFICKSKNLANYLVKHGSKMIDTDGFNVFYFEKDKTIQKNLLDWDKLNKISMF